MTSEFWVASVDEVMKFVPCRSRVKLAVAQELPQAAIVFGAMELSVGSGLGGALIVKTIGFESPLFPAPEKGLCVITVAVPGFATRAAGTEAEMLMMLLLASRFSVVASFFPFQVTYVCVTNPEPDTVISKVGLPALMFEGDRNVMEAPVLF
jgi:hypothetical protein